MELKTQEDLTQEYNLKILNEKNHKKLFSNRYIKPICQEDKIKAIDFLNKNIYKNDMVINSDYFFNTSYDDKDNKKIDLCFFSEIALNEKCINGFKYLIKSTNQEDKQQHKNLLNSNKEDNKNLFDNEYKIFLGMFNKKKYKKDELKKEINLFIDNFRKFFNNEFIFNNDFLNLITYKTYTEKEQIKKQHILNLILKNMLDKKIIKKKKEKKFYFAGLRGDNLRIKLNCEGELKTNDFNINNTLKYFLNIKDKKTLLISSFFSPLNFNEVVLKSKEKILKYFNFDLIREDKSFLYVVYNDKNDKNNNKNISIDKDSFNLFIDNLIKDYKLSREVIYKKSNKKNCSVHINKSSQKLFLRSYKLDSYILKKPLKQKIKKDISYYDLIKQLELKPTEKINISEIKKDRINHKYFKCCNCKKDILDFNIFENKKFCLNCSKKFILVSE